MYKRWFHIPGSVLICCPKWKLYIKETQSSSSRFGHCSHMTKANSI